MSCFVLHNEFAYLNGLIVILTYCPQHIGCIKNTVDYYKIKNRHIMELVVSYSIRFTYCIIQQYGQKGQK